jgi:multiple sugar transport system permease protein
MKAGAAGGAESKGFGPHHLRPALATLTVLSFLTNGNDFLWPLYVLYGAEPLTLPAGLGNLHNAATTNYPIAMA